MTFDLLLAFNSTQGKSTTGGTIAYVQIFENYKPYYAQALASFLLRTPAGCSWDQKLVLWKLKEKAPLASSPTSHEPGQ